MPETPVLESFLHHRESGSGTPVVFLHGNPTSSHLWRHITPEVPGHTLAPDLIGMGESGTPEIDYTFAEHAEYLDAWFDALGLDGVFLVGHDWGGALAFDWAARHPGRVRGIAFTEAIVKPMAWHDLPAEGQELFRAIKDPGFGEADLGDFLHPFPAPQNLRPVLRFARSLPLGGEPAEVVARVEEFDAWLAASPEVPKLLLAFRPGRGAMDSAELLRWCQDTVAGLEIARHDLVAGHHTPEDQPAAIAATLAAWLREHG